MTPLKFKGYTETTVQKREICIAELKLHIIQAFAKHTIKEMRVVCLDDGTVETFRSIEDVLANDWCGDCKIEIINLAYKYGSHNENEEFEQEFEEDATIILFQTAGYGYKPI